MDDELQELETELRGLRPAALPAEFRARLEGSLGRGRQARILRFSWLALPVAAAAAMAFMLAGSNALLRREPTARVAMQPPAVFKPVAAENVLLSSRDEGYVTLADGTPARRTSRSYVDTITWKNPRTKASLSWSFPREEVRITPISYE